MAFTAYQNGGFDALNQGLSSLGTGIDSYIKQQKLSDLGKQLAAGDYAGAVQSALASGDVSTGLSLLKLKQQRDSVSDPTLGGALGASPALAMPSTSATPAPVGGFGNAVIRTLGFEGGMNSNDSNGAPSNYGINAAANPDINVADLTPDKAKAIYKSRYWDTLGLDNVDPRLAHVVFDTAVNAGPGKAQELMDASGGDPNKFLALRTQFHGDLLKSNPEKFGPYAKSWSDRLAGLRADINAPGGGAKVVASDASDSGESGDNTGAVAKLRQQRDNLLVSINRYGAAGNEAAVKALTLKYNDLGQQIKDATENYVIHTAPDGQSLIAISKTDPTKVVPIQAGKPKSQAEVDARTQIAEQLGLQGDERKQYLLNGKVPDQSRVLKPGDVLTGPQGQELSRNTSAPAMTDQAADMLAERVLAGDSRALIGLGRGAQGAENIAKIQGLVAQKAGERSIDASDMLANVAKQQGLGAQQRTFGNQTARMATASTEAEGALDLARQSSDKVWRSGFLPLTKVYQAYQTNTNDPKLAEFVAAHNALINTYARAISPNGVPTVADKEHARDVLSTAKDKPSYDAVLNQFQREINIAHGAPQKAQQLMEDIRQRGKTNKTGGVVPPAEGATATGPNGVKAFLRGGNWVDQYGQPIQ